MDGSVDISASLRWSKCVTDPPARVICNGLQAKWKNKRSPFKLETIPQALFLSLSPLMVAKGNKGPLEWIPLARAEGEL